jgi:hypothetical protein
LLALCALGVHHAYMSEPFRLRARISADVKERTGHGDADLTFQEVL